MTRQVHFVGSIGLDTVEEIFSTVGRELGSKVQRCPDGEVGGRRLWITWQYPLLRSSPYLSTDYNALVPGVGVCMMDLAEGVDPAEVSFGELGYAREARASYQDFLAARECGDLAPGTRFQVSLPTPYAILCGFIKPDSLPLVEPAYEAAMLREVGRLCDAIPHHDLSIQWDICMEMVMYDGRLPIFGAPDNMDEFLGERFARLAEAIPGTVELGFHLCYGDLDAKHFIEPTDTGKATAMANLITRSIDHPVGWIHLPVPVDRDDLAYFEPLANLELGAETELFLGLVHASDGVMGARRRIATAEQVVENFGIATECGIARVRTPELVRELLHIHALAAD